jgi:hypothetical protein
MFTKNWYKVIARPATGATDIMFKNTKGNEVASASFSGNVNLSTEGGYYNNPTMLNMQTSFSGRSGVVIGTGTTPPTIDDYRLAGDFIQTYTFNTSLTKQADADGVTVTALYTITNTGSKEFTIGEIGLFANPIANNASDMCLYDRTVLETPITIPAGGIGQVTYTIRMNYPTT